MIGFVGLGNMGGAIAERLLHHGADLMVFDVDGQAMDRLVSAGARAGESIRQVADEAPLILSCLPSPQISLAMAREAMRGERVHLVAELSTTGRTAVAEMAEILAGSEIVLVDAPVSGGPLGARQGTLSLMLAGPGDASAEVADACLLACGKITQIGAEAGQAQLCKLVNNGISMTAFLVSCEAVAAAAGWGLSAEAVLEEVNSGLGRNSGTVTKIPQYILRRTFDMGGVLGSALKDLDLFLAELRGAGLPDGVVEETRALWARIAQELDPGADAATIVTYFEQRTGVPVVADQSGVAGAANGDLGLGALVDKAIGYTVLAATCEAMATGVAGGIDAQVLLEAINAGTACNHWSETLFERTIPQSSFAMEETIGEACSALDAYLARAEAVHMPDGLVRRTRQVWRDAAAVIGSEGGISLMIKRYEDIVGKELRSAARV